MNDRREQDTQAARPPGAGAGVDERLDALLAEARIPVRPDFVASVMRSLPDGVVFAPRRRRAWWAPAAAVAGFAALALVAALGVGGAPAALGVLRTLGDLAGSSLLAGAGLLVASWRGVGLLVREALGGSLLAMGLLAAVVIGLNLLAWRAFLPHRAGRRTGR